MFKNPTPTVDIIIWDPNLKKVVLIKRANPPFGWALPGGFVDEGECLEDAAEREAKEETNLDCRLICLFHAYSAPQRDSRQHTISTVFIASSSGELASGDDAKDARWFDINSLPKLAFDHAEILDNFRTIYIEGDAKLFLRKSWKSSRT